jgi:prepilin-type N-terminal cleavage/methylation domain-containing protein
MKIITSTKAGFTLVEILIVVAIIGLLASIAVPSYVHARDTSQQNSCINTLRQIDGAAQSWALENRKTSDDTYSFAVIQPYLKLDSNGNIPRCPAGGTYSPGLTVSNPPSCSIPGHKMP